MACIYGFSHLLFEFNVHDASVETDSERPILWKKKIAQLSSLGFDEKSLRNPSPRQTREGKSNRSFYNEAKVEAHTDCNLMLEKFARE